MSTLFTTRTLSAGQTCSFNPTPGTQLRVHSGVLWVTQSGQPDDHFVQAGRALTLQKGWTVLENCGSERVCYTWIHPVPERAPSFLSALGRTLWSP